MTLNPSDELYFVNWDDYGERHVVYRIRVEQGTHISEFWRDGSWFQDQDIYRNYVNGFDPTVQRINKIQALEIIGELESV